MKQRFSSLDVKVIAHELSQSLVTLRVANVYDLSSKILLFKFAKPNSKKQLVIDSGFRCHLTEFARTTAAAPSAFVARLRKFLKTRRVTSVAQVGTDRIIEFQFSDGQYRLFLEFFASGNIILSDADLGILTIARNVPEGEAQEPQQVGLIYSLENRQNYNGAPALSKERVRAALQSAVDKAAAGDAIPKKQKAKSAATLRRSLAVSITELPPVIVDHVLQSHNFDATMKPDEILRSETLLDELVRLLSDARQTVEDITSTSACPGYIFAKRRDGKATSDDSSSTKQDLFYEDFHPFVPKMFQDDASIKTLEFPGYNQTVDEFFSSLEGQKLESRLSQREETARKRLDAARQDQAKRVEGLQEAQTMNLRRAAAIEANVERVQEAMDAVIGLIAQGMDWHDIGKLVEREKKRQNPVAEIIMLPLKLAENVITLSLAEEEAERDDDEDPFETDDSGSEDEDGKAGPEQGRQAVVVEINLGISPWGNAREYYDQKRTAAAKEEKTQMQAAKALKSAEQKINEDLKKGLKQEKALLQPIRKQLWFEKFTWFVSSDGYLVMGGKDTTQNELLYRQALRKGDVYCHADLRGAASVVVKNKPETPDAPIPPSTLTQAGSLAVCSSDAWDSKAGMGAWWVKADQVTKSAPTGEFLPPGAFAIKGEKNFLPPAQLLLGLGIMFRISDESKARHLKHRLDGGAVDQSVEVEQTPAREDALGDHEKIAQASSDDVSDVESEGEPGADSERGNPLQAPGDERSDDGLDAVDDDMSNLNVTEHPDECGPEEADAGRASAAGSRDEESPQPTEPAQALHTTREDPASRASEPSKKAPGKRGQKGKAKKIANKYKNQDDEDRVAAEVLIGAAAGKQRAETEAKARAEAQAELQAARERRRAQHQRQQQQTAEHEEMRRAMMDQGGGGGGDALEPDEAAKTAGLDALVGTPLPGDEVLDAVPVCAPWAALARLKYKVKMQPGPVKKGKAVKDAVERWKLDSAKKGAVDDAARDTEKMWPREVELLKALKPEDAINCVPVGRVKMMMAGAGAARGKTGGGGKGQGKGARGGRGSKRS